MSENKRTIRNIDADVMREARIYAIQTDRTLGELVTESLIFFMAEADDPAWSFAEEAA